MLLRSTSWVAICMLMWAGCASNPGVGMDGGSPGADAAVDAGQSPGTDAGVDAGTSSSDGGTTAFSCTGQPSAVSLSGTWAAIGQVAVKAQGAPGGALSMCPADQDGQAKLLFLMTIQQNASDPTKLDQVQGTLCSLELPTVTESRGSCDPASSSLVTVELSTPQPFPALAATTTGTLGGTAPGASISIDPLDVIIGSSAPSGSLPTWSTNTAICSAPNAGMSKTCDALCVSDCSKLRDDDLDGYPGVTLDVCGFNSSDTSNGVKCNAAMPATPGATVQGQGYVDLEVNSSAAGTVRSSCEISGAVNTRLLYNLVGAHVYVVGSPISVTSTIPSLPTFTTDPSASQLHMVRVDGQYGAPNWNIDPTQPAAACAIVNMHAGEL